MRKRVSIIPGIIVIAALIAVGHNPQVLEVLDPLVEFGWRSDAPDLTKFPNSAPHESTTSVEVIGIDETAPGLVPVTDPAARASAQAAIAQVDTAEPGPLEGYDRDEFGSRWSDDVDVTWGHNGCDTRNDILARDLAAETFRPGTQECVVVTGTLTDPYTATTILFLKEHADAVHIDHLVPLARAWVMGAARWDDSTREQFANDPLNLLAVDGPTNIAKSDSSPAEWMPANGAVSCAYAARYAAVSLRYDLPVSAEDHATMTRACA